MVRSCLLVDNDGKASVGVDDGHFFHPVAGQEEVPVGDDLNDLFGAAKKKLHFFFLSQTDRNSNSRTTPKIPVVLTFQKIRTAPEPIQQICFLSKLTATENSANQVGAGQLSIDLHVLITPQKVDYTKTC